MKPGGQEPEMAPVSHFFRYHGFPLSILQSVHP